MSDTRVNIDSVHCHDCCCARAWKALQITEYTGMSIPQHIELLRKALIESNRILHYTPATGDIVRAICANDFALSPKAEARI